MSALPRETERLSIQNAARRTCSACRTRVNTETGLPLCRLLLIVICLAFPLKGMLCLCGSKTSVSRMPAQWQPCRGAPDHLVVILCGSLRVTAVERLQPILLPQAYGNVVRATGGATGRTDQRITAIVTPESPDVRQMVANSFELVHRSGSVSRRDAALRSSPWERSLRGRPPVAADHGRWSPSAPSVCPRY